MRYFILLTFLFISPFSVADDFDYSEFGEEITLKDKPLAFGVVFSLGKIDPDGKNWLLSFTKKGPLPKGTKWNVYVKGSKEYAFSKWKDAPIGEVFQSRVKDPEAKKILPFQDELILVLKTADGKLMHLRLGDMCLDEKFEKHFKNLTDKKKCDEVTEGDVEQEATFRDSENGTH